MSSVVVIFKDDKFIVEQPVITDEKDFVLDYLSANNLDTSNVVATSYPRLKYLEFLQEARKPNSTFKIAKDRIMLITKKLVDTEVEYEIDWLSESNLENIYSPSEIQDIMENREYFESFGSLVNVDFANIPKVIPLKTRKVTIKEQKEDVLEEYAGKVIEL